MGTSEEGLVLAALEQAEMAARERRLAASSEAEDLLSAARGRSAVISSGAGQRVDAALEDLRRSAEGQADAAIEDLDPGVSRHSSTSPGAADPVVERAVAVVVAHVLGETDGGREGPS